MEVFLLNPRRTQSPQPTKDKNIFLPPKNTLRLWCIHPIRDVIKGIYCWLPKGHFF